MSTALRPNRRKNRKRYLEYLLWIKSLPCTVGKDCAGRIEAHHAGDHGLGVKADDRTAIPLCLLHHRAGLFSAHTLGKRFWTHHNIDRDALIASLQERYEQEAA